VSCMAAVLCEIFYNETWISEILLEMSWVTVFSFVDKLLLSTYRDRFSIAIQEEKKQ
jgi:hypothetical protein